MKAEILKILQMQQEGKLTQDQAAELLAILADQAREKTGDAAPSTESHTEASAGKGGAPDPRGGSAGKTGRGFAASSAAAIHGLVDTAIGVGTTIGRAASVFGGGVVEMVHRDEGGNSVTLSSVDAPTGEGFAFNGNTINVSKVAHLSLRQAEVCGNTVNASKIAHLGVTRGRFSQCNISGSSVHHVNVTGPDAAPPAPPAPPTTSASMPGTAETEAPPAMVAGIRALTLNASKLSRVRLHGAAALEVSTIQASSVKDWELSASTLRDSKFNDAAVTGLTLAQSTLGGITVERAHLQGLQVTDAALQDVRLSGIKLHDVKIAGGKWQDVKFRREAAGIGGRESVLLESTFEGCELTGCDFAGCTFRRTTLRKLKLSGITVRNVDFTGKTIETEADFRQVAGL